MTKLLLKNVYAHQNYDGLRDLATPLSGMVYTARVC